MVTFVVAFRFAQHSRTTCSIKRSLFQDPPACEPFEAALNWIVAEIRAEIQAQTWAHHGQVP